MTESVIASTAVVPETSSQDHAANKLRDTGPEMKVHRWLRDGTART